MNEIIRTDKRIVMLNSTEDVKGLMDFTGLNPEDLKDTTLVVNGGLLKPCSGFSTKTHDILLRIFHNHRKLNMDIIIIGKTDLESDLLVYLKEPKLKHDYVQLLNPRSHCYVVLDRSIGGIVKHGKIKNRPYKNIPIISRETEDKYETPPL